MDMKIEDVSIPYAHQQIRLGDIQAMVHQWDTAIEYYSSAIECFKMIQNTLEDQCLISMIQAQIDQCEKSICLFRAKDRIEQIIKDQQATLIQESSTSNQIDLDTSSPFIVLKIDDVNEINPIERIINAKKNKKYDSQKIEELQMSYEALKTHLKAAFDDIERLKYENKKLRIQQQQKQTDLQAIL